MRAVVDWRGQIVTMADPERFAKIVRDFVRSTEPSHYDRERWRELLDEGAAVTPVQAQAGSSPLAPVSSVRRAAGG